MRARPDCLIAVPTLGQRPEFLTQALSALAGQTHPVDVVVVAPLTDAIKSITKAFQVPLIPDPGSLPAAINLAFSEFGSKYEFFNWLGDDDLLPPTSVETVRKHLQQHPAAIAAFGWCEYIDDDGSSLWTSKAGGIAPWLMTWGPDLVPQPGMLIRTNAWSAVGGLDESLRFAFDLDLLLRLRKIGPFVTVPEVVSSFRWHATSLSVEQRSDSLREARHVKVRNSGRLFRFIAPLSEPLVTFMSNTAAHRLTRLSGTSQ